MANNERLTDYIRRQYPELYLAIRRSALGAKLSINEYISRHLPQEVLLKLKAKDPSLITDNDIEALVSRIRTGQLEQIVATTVTTDCTQEERGKILSSYLPELPPEYLAEALPRAIPRLNLGIISMPTGSGIEKYDEMLDPTARAIVAAHLRREAEALRRDDSALRELLLDRITKTYVRKLQLARTPDDVRALIVYERGRLSY